LLTLAIHAPPECDGERNPRKEKKMTELQMRNGDQIPAIGLGTWKMTDGIAVNSIQEAIKLGYRHIDCAHIYGNESDVGEGLSLAFRDGNVQRSDVWITSKLWNDCHRTEHVRPALEQSLKHLNLEYLDLYLMHWPIVHRHGVALPESVDDYETIDQVPLLETWQAMEQCVRAGLCKHIGVSNFNQHKLQRLLDQCSIPPAMNQVESHPFLQQNGLLEFCQSNKMQLTAYSPLGSADRPDRLRKENEPALLAHPTLTEIASEHSATSAQILLAWAVNRNTATIPKSTNPIRMAENLRAGEIVLTAEQFARIAKLDSGYRFIDGRFWSSFGGPYTLEYLWSE